MVPDFFSVVCFSWGVPSPKKETVKGHHLLGGPSMAFGIRPARGSSGSPARTPSKHSSPAGTPERRSALAIRKSIHIQLVVSCFLFLFFVCFRESQNGENSLSHEKGNFHRFGNPEKNGNHQLDVLCMLFRGQSMAHALPIAPASIWVLKGLTPQCSRPGCGALVPWGL